MQTGPAPNQSMDRWLVWTGLLELLNVALFALILTYFARANPGVVGPLSLVGFTTLEVVLAQGGIYWLLKRARFFDGSPPSRVILLLRALYAFDVLLLLVFPFVALWSVVGGQARPYDFLIGLGCYVFGAGEFVHYFVFKINMRPRELRRVLAGGRPVPSRLRRELKRAGSRLLL